MRPHLPILLPVLLSSLLLGPAPTRSDAACAALFDDLKTRIETDYIGYAMAIAPDAGRLARYRAAAARARTRASAAAPADCTFALRALTDHLDDPHVFLLERPELSAEAAAASLAARPRWPGTTPAARAGAEGLEGAWAGPEFDAVVVADGRGRFTAVVTRARAPAWAVGDVAARFETRGGEVLATLYRAEDRAPIRYRAALQRDGLLLHMPPITWGRRTDARAPQDAGFNPEKPRAPTFAALGPKASILSIPSFSPEHREAIAALLAAHDAEIRARGLLVIDLRGNEGGSSGLGALLEPWYGSAAPRPDTGPRPNPTALASARMIAYFSGLRDSLPQGEDRAFFDAFIARMQAAPGRLVAFFESPDQAAQLMAPRPAPVLHPEPAQVAILVDRHTVSAAEAFLLAARRSPRVTVFGENTGGSIDYQNVAMFGLGQGPLRHTLGLPTSAASDELPAKGFNATGVPVDVPLAGERDWVGAVLRRYGAGG